MSVSDSLLIDALFQSTLPMRGATEHQKFFGAFALFQSTLPMRGATNDHRQIAVGAHISIHAPHAGSDKKADIGFFFPVVFQTTLPMRGATPDNDGTNGTIIFQSTPPMRGATRDGIAGSLLQRHFNPRSPCGERRRQPERMHERRNFNPRSPCGERRDSDAR